MYMDFTMILFHGYLRSVQMNSIFLLFASIASLIPFGNSMTVTAYVKDDDGQPISNATVKVWTDKSRYGGWAKSSQYDYYTGITDMNGSVKISFACYVAYFEGCAYSDRHYREDCGYIEVKHIGHADWSATLTEHSKEIHFTLRRKRNPASLCYTPPSFSAKLPNASGEFGFDLLMDDWIAPHGDGKVADFYVQRETSPTNDQVTVNSSIVFKEDGNGAYIRKKVKTTSDFKTDYEADTNGTYLTCIPLQRYPAPDYPRYTYSSIVKEDEYLVMRTRVEKDVKGNIVKATYSAMCGTVHINGHFSCLGYVFNPAPNDPNLEMDRKRSINLERAKKKRRYRPYPRGWNRQRKDINLEPKQ